MISLLPSYFSTKGTRLFTHKAWWFLLLFLNNFCSAQEINGFWKGTLTMQGGCFVENNIELQITAAGRIVTGTSYHYLNVENYIKKDFRGRYDSAAKTLIISEGAISEFKIPSHCVVCIKQYSFTYTKKDNVETLEGGWTGFINGTGSSCQPGTIILSRIKTSAFKEVSIPQINVDTGQIRLDFYDNGTIDGDSISVLVDQKVVLSHQKLSAQPVTTFITINLAQPVHEVVMVAENMGSIPPNTALLIITAGEKRYRLFLNSTEMKSAKARFVYSKDRGVAK